jgi:hypothetical protein
MAMHIRGVVEAIAGRVALAALLAVGLAACEVHVGQTDVVSGSGNVKTESRSVAGFNRVALTGIGTLMLTQGSAEALTVQAEDNLLPKLGSTVEGSTLRLGPVSGAQIAPTRPIRYELTVKQLDTIELSGAGEVLGSRLNAGQLTVSATGAGHVNLSGLTVSSLTVEVTGTGDVTMAGQTPQQSVSISGTGRYQADGLATQRTIVAVTGAGSCAVRASEHLSATITGAGRVTYVGSPTVDQSITGAGSIDKTG